MRPAFTRVRARSAQRARARMTPLPESPTGVGLRPGSTLRERWLSAERLSRDHLFRSAHALMLSTVATSAFGIAYWIVAARAYPPRALGEGAAAISTMLMLSNFAQMNLYFGLTRFIPTAGQATGRLIGYSYAASAAAALLLGTGFVVVAPRVSDNLSFLQTGALGAVAFVLSVAVWGLFALQDGVLPALRRASWVPVENALFGLVKLGLLVALAGVYVSGGIFASWNLAVLMAVVPINLLIYRRLIPSRSTQKGTITPFSFKGVARFVGIDYIGSLFLQSYTTALPLLIVATLGAEANADFYVAYAVIVAVDLLSANLATSLLVEAAHDEDRLREYTRRVLCRSALFLVAVVLFLELAAPYLLSIFGGDYAQDSTTLLRILALASLPRMVSIVYMAAMRVERRVGRVVMVQAATSVLVVSLTLALVSDMGVNGVGLAWLCAHSAVALALVPWLRRALRPAERVPS
jgi:O-antigen/teichoic acid export membrane protein